MLQGVWRESFIPKVSSSCCCYEHNFDRTRKGLGWTYSLLGAMGACAASLSKSNWGLEMANCWSINTTASNSLQSNCRVSHTTIHDVLYWVSNECDHLIGRTRVPPKKTHQSETSSADPPPHKHTSLVGTNWNSNMTSTNGAILEPLPPCAPSPSCKQIRREKL